jgi:hypothetical protein
LNFHEGIERLLITSRRGAEYSTSVEFLEILSARYNAAHDRRSSIMLRRFHDDETGQGRVEHLLGIAMLNRSAASSMDHAIPDLVIGACILIGLGFVIFWLLDRD